MDKTKSHKTKKRNIGSNPITTITITRKDRDFLHNLKKKMRLDSIEALVTKIIQTIKFHKLEEEIK